MLSNLERIDRQQLALTAVSNSRASNSTTIMSGRKRMPSYRIWGSTENGEVEFESLTTETLEGALRVIRESFFKHESVCQGVDLASEPGAAEELVELCRIAAQDGVSVVAIEIATGQVVAVAFNKIQILPPAGVKSLFETFIDNCKYDSSRALVQFMVDVDTRLNIFEHHNVENILEIMFIATLPSHSKRRLGELVTAASVEIARQLKTGNDVKTPVNIRGVESIANKDAVPELCSALCTSVYSYKLFQKLGFDTLLTAHFTEFEFKGKKFSERIGEKHKVCQLVTKRLSPMFTARQNGEHTLPLGGVFYVGTNSRHGGIGIGLNLVKAFIELGQRLGKIKHVGDVTGNTVTPEVIFGIFTSNFSQLIASRLNFEWLASVF